MGWTSWFDLFGGVALLAILLVAISFLAAWEAMVKVYRRLQFRIVFSVWPEANPRLKGLLEKQWVEYELGNLALDLDICYQNQEELHRVIKIGEIPFEEAKKQLSQSDRTVAKTKARFNRARNIARDWGFNAHDIYSEYLAVPRPAFPEKQVK